MRIQYFITLIYGFWKFAVVTKRKHNKLIKEYIEVRLNIILYFLVFDSPYYYEIQLVFKTMFSL